jgi:hypothetical protein
MTNGMGSGFRTQGGTSALYRVPTLLWLAWCSRRAAGTVLDGRERAHPVAQQHQKSSVAIINRFIRSNEFCPVLDAGGII